MSSAASSSVGFTPAAAVLYLVVRFSDLLNVCLIVLETDLEKPLNRRQFGQAKQE